MMTHISSVGLGSHIVSVFMLTWGRGPFLLVSLMLKMVSFMVFWGRGYGTFAKVASTPRYEIGNYDR